MAKFEKQMPMSPWKLIIFSVFSFAFMALVIFVIPHGDPFGWVLLVGMLSLALAIAWWRFYYKLQVSEIEIAKGFVNIRWKNRMGKERQASLQSAELYYRYGSTGGKNPLATLDLYEKSNTGVFKRPFMRIIDRIGGWKLSDFAEIELAYKAGGIEQKERSARW